MSCIEDICKVFVQSLRYTKAVPDSSIVGPLLGVMRGSMHAPERSAHFVLTARGVRNLLVL
jgi:hypothetical protein